jgi:outer membrane protein OmpA-like peptidoglycan-associated protein
MKIPSRALFGILAALLGGACASRGVSPQLSAARRVMESARNSPAQELEGDQLLAAQRNLTLAEEQADDSMLEAHYAYVAERQIRIAMSSARRTLLERGARQERDHYHSQLEDVARDRREELEDSRDDLAARDATVAQQGRELSASETALASEPQSRVEAEAAEATAIERLRALTDVRVGPAETVITLSGEVLFESSRAVLRPEAHERLGAVAEALRASPERFAIVAGYTDSRGTESRNRELSRARAQSVADFLLQAGVSADRIQVEGRGESLPVADNTSAEGRANNRRVEIILRPVAAPSGESGH